MSGGPWIEYDFATLRLVPRVHRSEFQNLGVVLHAPAKRILIGRFVDDFQCPDVVDAPLVRRYLATIEEILQGKPGGGPIASLSASERFHWLTAPRSDILQPSPVHHGRCHELDACLEELFQKLVA